MKVKIQLFFILFWVHSYSQSKDGVVTYNCYYNETQATEELKKINPYTYNNEIEREGIAKSLSFELHFNSDYSYFKFTEGLIPQGIDPTNYEIAQSVFYGNDRFFTDINRGNCTEIANIMGRTTIINWNIASQEWQMLNETKIIDGYLCYKATSLYKYHWNGKDRQSNLVAWYCPSIPLKVGPIRYSGLPGLILELSEGYRTWTATKINLNSKSILTSNFIEKTKLEIEKSTLEDKEEIDKKVLDNKS